MDMKSKLKFMPNKSLANSKSTTCWSRIAVFRLFFSIILLISIVNCVDSSPQPETSIIAAAEAATARNINETTSKFDRDVKDLKLLADFRAVKLRWSYEHSEANEPASFDIRYCELTSWDIEIKCRHRDLKVAPLNSRFKSTQQFEDEKLANGSKENEKSSVIPVKRLYPTELVHQLSNFSNQYELQIFDLRALTNYTFQVRVSRFLHEPELVTSHQQIKDSQQLQMPFTERRNRMQAARRLNNVADEHPEHPVSRRVETKPFGAEATKCLADASEVMVYTGRYFGGRISVEGSSDPRCNLIGNRSSEQTNYIFRIDHQVCDSKIVDGNRIETMVLVHENKDILTHNTARFLVLCNFLQKSFTLRASISLPKVNGAVAQSRPAVIFSLPQKPLDNNNVTEDHSMSILLGSMPGVYRARNAPNTNVSQHQGNSSSNIKSGGSNNNNSNNKAYSYSLPTFDEQQQMQQVNQDVNRSSPASNSTSHIVDELETNTIEKFIDKKSSRSSGQQQQQQQQQQQEHSATTAKSPITTGNNNNSSSSLLQTSRRSSSDNSVVGSSRAEARSLTLPSLDGSIDKLPQPVRVQSKLLFVERSNPASRIGRQQQRQHHGKPITTLQANLVERSTSSSQFDTFEPNASANATLAPTTVPPTSSQTITTTSLSPLATGERDTFENEDGDLTSALRNLKQWPRNKPPRRQREEVGADLHSQSQQSPSIIMTNNHRIPGDYLPLTRSTAVSLNSNSNSNSNLKPSPGVQSLANSNNFSIRYSAAKVDEFSVGQGDADVPLLESFANNNSSTSEGREGRMKADEDVPRSLSAPTLNSQPKSQEARANSFWTVDNRMGEMVRTTKVKDRSNNNDSPAEPQQVDLLGETSNNEFSSDARPSSGLPAINGTLAQNITSFILKWSLKTLTNFAQKSFESLANQNGSGMSTSMYNKSDFVSDNEHQHEYEQKNEPIQNDQLRINLSSNNQPAASVPNFEGLLKNPASRKTSASSDRGIGNGTATVAATTLAPVATTTTSSQTVVFGLKKEVSPSSIKPALLVNSSQVQDKMLDDFMTNANRAEEVSRTNTVTLHTADSLDNNHHLRQHNHSRPSNYSKSLDLSRITGGESASSSNRLRNSEKNNTSKANTTRHRNKHNHHHYQQQQSVEERQDHPIQSNQESAWTNRDPFYSSWMFYGLLLFIAIITGTFSTFWLFTVPLCENKVKSSGRHVNKHNDENHNNNYHDPQVFLQGQQHSVFESNNTIAPQAILKVNQHTGAICIDNDPNSPRSRSLLDISYQRYDYNKFGIYQSDATSSKNSDHNPSAGVSNVNENSNANNGNNSKMNNNDSSVGNSQNKSNCAIDQIIKREDKLTARELISGRLDQQSPSSTSQRTRSTSAGSTIMVDENDCKNNEFFYREHVLINPGSNLGESYA